VDADATIKGLRNPATSLEPSLVTNSLCPEQEEHTMRETEVQIGNFARELLDTDKYQNFTIVLRVSVTWLVTTVGPPLKRWNAAYCSIYVSSDDRQSIGTITL
jgi:hypothetical protein